MNYWLDLFTGKTWQEFLEAGASVSGFREARWKTIQKLKMEDHLLCYITGISPFVGILEVDSDVFKNTSKRIWSDDALPPCHINVKPLFALKPELPSHATLWMTKIGVKMPNSSAVISRARG